MPTPIVDADDQFPDLVVPADGDDVDGDSWEVFGQDVGDRTRYLHNLGPANFAGFSINSASYASNAKVILVPLTPHSGGNPVTGTSIGTNAGDIVFNDLGWYELHYHIYADPGGSQTIRMKVEYNGSQIGPFADGTGGVVSGVVLLNVTNLSHVAYIVQFSGANRTVTGTVLVRRVT